MMKTFMKRLIVGSTPLWIMGAAPVVSDGPVTPATMTATQPAPAPATEPMARVDGPLVIPDGTSLTNPGPGATGWQGGGSAIAGLRR